MSHFRSLTHLLQLCSKVQNLTTTKIIHAHIMRTTVCDIFDLQMNLISAYAHCSNHLNSLFNLLNIIKPITNPSPWNAAIATETRRGFYYLSMEIFTLIQNFGTPMNSYASCSALISCSCTQNLKFGIQIHAGVVKMGWYSNVYVGSALINLYVKSLIINDAQQTFEDIPHKNIVCFNALLTGYADARLWVDGLDMTRLHTLQMKPDMFTLAAILRICSGIPSFDKGKEVHCRVIRTISNSGIDAFIQSVLIEMYGKCGRPVKARLVFDSPMGIYREKVRDVVLWTSMLNAYGRNGSFDDVIKLFDEMLKQSIMPDQIAFVTVLSACARAGYVSKGMSYFQAMERDFGVLRQEEHYGCVVDMLCRAGELEKAWALASEAGRSVSAWGALLSGCKENGSVEMGEIAAAKALELEPGNIGIYVELSNLFGRKGLWNKIEELRALMKERGLKKNVGLSWINVNV